MSFTSHVTSETASQRIPRPWSALVTAKHFHFNFSRSSGPSGSSCFTLTIRVKHSNLPSTAKDGFFPGSVGSFSCAKADRQLVLSLILLLIQRRISISSTVLPHLQSPVLALPCSGPGGQDRTLASFQFPVSSSQVSGPRTLRRFGIQRSHSPLLL